MIREELFISEREREMLQKMANEQSRFPKILANAVAKRKQEYLAGRLCADQALKKAGFSGSPDVGMAQDRSPVWPEGYVGSITHTQGYACAIVADKSEYLGLGVDAEPVMDGETLGEICDFALLDSELALYEGGFRRMMTLKEFGTLIFSAKESVYKCLYPLVRRFFGFHDVQIVAIDTANKTFQARLLRDLSEDYRIGFQLDGSYRISDIVCTFTKLPNPYPRGN